MRDDSSFFLLLKDKFRLGQFYLQVEGSRNLRNAEKYKYCVTSQINGIFNVG
jgi:hypothetical protein